VADNRDLQKSAQRIGSLVQELETIADPAARSRSKELIQLLLDLHGAGLERMLDIVFRSGDPGRQVIDEFGQDSLVSCLLVLYGIHPEDLQTRVERKVTQIQSKLHKMGAEAELVSVQDGVVRLRVKVEGHGCGSTKRNVQSTIEESIYEAAPDLTSLIVEGLEEPTASGFVAVEKLLGSASPMQTVVLGGEAVSPQSHR
jgi:Fe-S cluster biogenesis protein NfuA